MGCGFFCRIRLLYLKEFISAPCMLCDSFILPQCELIPPLACLEILMFSKTQAFIHWNTFMQCVYLLVALFNIEIRSFVDEISCSVPECVVMSYIY